jgi:transcriptional regulator with XRE-family HTH domain
MKDCENLSVDFIVNLHKRIGANVQRIRKEKNISQLKFSYAMGYKSVSAVSCGEIAYILEVDICEFFK